jgi:hypothetical protein
MIVSGSVLAFFRFAFYDFWFRSVDKCRFVHDEDIFMN